jgi:hypothetical protein
MRYYSFNEKFLYVFEVDRPKQKVIKEKKGMRLAVKLSLLLLVVQVKVAVVKNRGVQKEEGTQEKKSGYLYVVKERAPNNRQAKKQNKRGRTPKRKK